MSAPLLTESAWLRAKSNAAGVYGSAAFSIALGLGALLAIPPAVLLADDGASTAVKVGVPVLTGAAVILIMLVAVLVFQVLVAPIRQRNELRLVLAEASPPKPPHVPLKLRNFRRRGQDLLRRLGPEGYTAGDQQAIERWTEETVDFLSEHGDAELATSFIEASGPQMHLIPSLEKRVAALDAMLAEMG